MICTSVNVSSSPPRPAVDDGPDGFVCAACGHYIGDPWYCGPAGHSICIGTKTLRACEVCHECYLDAHIPKNFSRWECYVSGIATRRPRLGIDWLDEQPWTLREKMLICRRKPRWRGGD